MTYFVERPAPCSLEDPSKRMSRRISRLWRWILARPPGHPSTDRLSQHLLRDIGLDDFARGSGKRHR